MSECDGERGIAGLDFGADGGRGASATPAASSRSLLLTIRSGLGDNEGIVVVAGSGTGKVSILAFLSKKTEDSPLISMSGRW